MELFRLGVSLFIVDRISNDIRRITSAFRAGRVDLSQFDMAIANLQRTVGRTQAWKQSEDALERWVNTHRKFMDQQKKAKQLEADADAQAIRITKGKEHVAGRTPMTAQQLNMAWEQVHMKRDEARALQESAFYLKEEHQYLKLQETQRLRLAELRKMKDVADKVGIENLEKLEKVEENVNKLEQTRDRLADRRYAIDQQRRGGRAEAYALGGMGALGIGLGVARLGEFAVQQYMPIQTAQVQLQAIAQMTADDVKALTALARNVAPGLAGFTMSDVLNIGLQMTRAGMRDPGMVKTFLPMMAQAADITQALGIGDPVESVRNLIQMSQAAGLSDPKQAQRMMEEVIALVAQDPTTMSSFMTHFLTLLPSMRTINPKGGFGMVEETMQMTAFAELMGARGGFSTNLLSTLLTRLKVETPKGAGALKALTGWKDMPTDIHEIIQKFQQDFAQDPSKFAGLMMLAAGGVRGLRSVLALGGLDPTEFERLWAQVGKIMHGAMTLGATEAMLQTPLERQLFKLRTNADQLAAAIGEHLAPKVEGWIKWTNALVVAMDELLKKHPELTGQIVRDASMSTAAMIGGGALVLAAAPVAMALPPVGAAMAYAGLGLLGGGAFFGGMDALDFYIHHPELSLDPSRNPAIPGPTPPVVNPYGGFGRGLSRFGSTIDRWGSAAGEEIEKFNRWWDPDARPMAFHGDVHIHAGVITADFREWLVREVARGVHDALYNIGSSPDGTRGDTMIYSPRIST